MSATLDGGSAFPHDFPDHHGMSLRDYFAAQVLPQVYATSVLAGHGEQEAIAAEAYEIADAMLAERAK